MVRRLLVLVIAGVGSLLDGIIYETLGGYNAALVINAVLGFAAAAGVLLVPRLGVERAARPSLVPAREEAPVPARATG